MATLCDIERIDPEKRRKKYWKNKNEIITIFGRQEDFDDSHKIKEILGYD